MWRAATDEAAWDAISHENPFRRPIAEISELGGGGVELKIFVAYFLEHW